MGNPMTTKRRRLTRAELAELDARIVDVLAADHPQSVRHVFYRLTDPRLPVPVPKTEQGYKRVQRRCLELRRNGRLPYGWIVDATRRGYHVATFHDPSDFIDSVAGLYRSRLWTEAEPLVEVWCESRSIAGVLQNECERLAVSLYPAGGFSSATLCYEAAREIDRQGRDEAVILYVGDFDPAGVMIDRAIECELNRHLDTPLTFRRLAINEAQIDAFDLPTKPRKAGDRRRLDITETVEAEAMPAAHLRALVGSAVEAYLPPDALQVAKAAEESERAALFVAADYLRDGFIGRAP